MALSPSADWTAAFSKGTVEPRLLLTLWTGTSVSWKFLSGKSSVLDYPETISSASSVRRAMDPFTRKTRTSGMTIELLQDPYVLDLITSHATKGSAVTVELGTADLAEADYVAFFGGIVDEVIPDGTVAVSLVLKTPDSKLRDYNVLGAFVLQHPLGIIDSVMTSAGIVAAEKDSTSLDPDTYTSTHSHWVVDRSANSVDTGLRAYTELTPATDVIDEMAMLLNGHIATLEDGKVHFLPYNSSDASVADWTEDDIRDIDIVDLYGGLVNKVSVSSHAYTPETPGISEERIAALTSITVAEDTASQATFGYKHSSGLQDLVAEKSLTASSVFDFCYISDEWVSGVSPGVGDTVNLRVANGSVSGTRWAAGSSFPSGSQPAAAEVSPTRLMYVRIGTEIVSLNDLTMSTINVASLRTFDESGDGSDGSYGSAEYTVPRELQAKIAERGAKSTTAAAHEIYSRFRDVTIPLSMAESRIERFSSGGAVIRVETSMAEFAWQIGDVITVTTSRYKALNKNGLDTNTKWEIVGKEADLDSEDPGIRWELAFHHDTSSVTTIPSFWKKPVPSEIFEGLKEAVINDDVARSFVLSGLTVANFSGFDADLLSGEATSLVSRIDRPTDLTYTYSASKDTYVFIDMISGLIGFEETALGAGTPTLLDQEMMLSKVVTDGSGVTSATDLRTTGQPIAGSKLLEGSGPLTYLDVGGTITAAAGLADGIVETAKIDGFAVTATKISTGAVTTVKLNDQAVTTDKIGGSAVLVSHMDTTRLFGETVPNGLFSHFTSGSNKPPDGWTVGAGDWGSSADIAQTTTEDESGEFAIHFRNTSTTPTYLYSSWIPVVEDSSITFSARALSDSSSTDQHVSVQLEVWDRDRSNAINSSDSSPAGTSQKLASGAWATISITLDMSPAAWDGARWARMRIGKEHGASGTFNVHFDRVSVTWAWI